MRTHGLDLTGKVKIQRVSTLPSWTSDDEARIIYVLDEKKLYYADSTSWITVEIGLRA